MRALFILRPRSARSIKVLTGLRPPHTLLLVEIEPHGVRVRRLRDEHLGPEDAPAVPRLGLGKLQGIGEESRRCLS